MQLVDSSQSLLPLSQIRQGTITENSGYPFSGVDSQKENPFENPYRTSDCVFDIDRGDGLQSVQAGRFRCTKSDDKYFVDGTWPCTFGEIYSEEDPVTGITPEPRADCSNYPVAKSWTFPVVCHSKMSKKTSIFKIFHWDRTAEY